MQVFGPGATQQAVYDATAAPLVAAVLRGFNATVFAYGQTGCGKTHTMEGAPAPPEARGLIPRVFEHIFAAIQAGEREAPWLGCPGAGATAFAEPRPLPTPHPAPPPGEGGCQYLVRVSHLEIYNEEVRDLLGRDPKARLELREAPRRGVYAKGLREFVVKSAEEMAAVLQV